MQSGGYGNVSEVFREALRLWEKAFQPAMSDDDLVREKVYRGIESWEAGRYTELNGPEEIAAHTQAIFDKVMSEKE